MRLRGPGPAVMIFAITSAIFLASPVRGLTDSRYSTLVSEALFRHGSFVLDEWFGDRANLPYQVETVGGHVYYWYPPGGPVLATPFVWVLAQLGLSAVGHGGSYDSARDRIVQAVLAALFMGLLAVIFLKTALPILPPRWSWIVALAGSLATQVWSTASRVLWSDTFLVLILGAVVWLLVLHETKRRPLSAPLLATLLAWAYFARPTASLAIMAVTLYLALHHRALVVSYLATGVVWIGVFVTYSWLAFGTLLPSYYRISTFSLRTFGGGLLGILFSPSRGQLVFVPVTLFISYLVVRYWRSLPLSRLIMPALLSVPHVRDADRRFRPMAWRAQLWAPLPDAARPMVGAPRCPRPSRPARTALAGHADRVGRGGGAARLQRPRAGARSLGARNVEMEQHSERRQSPPGTSLELARPSASRRAPATRSRVERRRSP